MKVETLNAQGRQSPGGVASRGPEEAIEVVRAFSGVGVAEVREVYPATNAAQSARVYTVEPKDLLRSDREAERSGLSLIGVWHSHTHTPAYPSPTDIAQAPDPFWHYVLVSLSDTDPVLRSYRIVGGEVTEEQVLAVGM
jgi:proteasome lid subunit RPN8/RPN11